MYLPTGMFIANAAGEKIAKAAKDTCISEDLDAALVLAKGLKEPSGKSCLKEDGSVIILFQATADADGVALDCCMRFNLCCCRLFICWCV